MGRGPERQRQRCQTDDGKEPQSEVTSPSDQAAKEYDHQSEPKVLSRDKHTVEAVIEPHRTCWRRDDVVLQVAHVLARVRPDETRDVRGPASANHAG